MSGASNAGKAVNELRTQSGIFQSEIIEFGTALTEIDITTINSAYISWVHPIGTCTIEYWGKPVYENQDLTDAGYGEEIIEAEKVTISDLTTPFPISLKNGKVVITAGKAKVLFGWA